MEIVLIVVACLVGILALLLIIALFIPKHYSVSVSETIRRPKKMVFDYISLFRNQVHYSEWLRPDPDLKPEIMGMDGTVGAIMKWESFHEEKKKNVGMGEQEIKRMDSNSIIVELRLIKPMPAVCKVSNYFVEEGINETRYTCTFYGYAKYPINLPSYVLGRRFIREAQQKTLRNVKALVERGSV